jgi:hypothetical protein
VFFPFFVLRSFIPNRAYMVMMMHMVHFVLAFKLTNIVVILVETMTGVDYTTCHGHKIVSTPKLNEV